MTNHPPSSPIFDPRGTVTTAAVSLAPRVRSLDTLRIGIFDNSKWNASKLLRAVMSRVERNASGVTFTRYTKESFSRLAPDDLLDRVAAENDVVISAIGD